MPKTEIDPLLSQSTRHRSPSDFCRTDLTGLLGTNQAFYCIIPVPEYYIRPGVKKLVVFALLSLFNAILWTGGVALILHQSAPMTFILTFVFTFLVITFLAKEPGDSLSGETNKRLVIIDFWDY